MDLVFVKRSLEQKWESITPAGSNGIFLVFSVVVQFDLGQILDHNFPQTGEFFLDRSFPPKGIIEFAVSNGKFGNVDNNYS